MSADPAFWEVFVRSGTRRPGGSSRRPASRTTAGSSSRPAAPARSPSRCGPARTCVFSPLAATADGGASWSAGPPIDAAVAASPDAFAADGAKLVALLSDGAVETSADAGATWSVIAKPGAIAASAAAKGCGGAVRVTSVSFGLATIGALSTDVLAGGTLRDQRYRRAVLLLPRHGLAAGQPAGRRAAGAADRRHGAGAGQVRAERAVARVRLVRVRAPLAGTPQPAPTNWSASGDAAGFRPGHRVGDAGRRRDVGAAFRRRGRRRSAGRQGQQWTLLPPVPAGDQRCSRPGPGGATDALAVSGATLTVWRLAPKATVWSKVADDQRADPVRLLRLGRVPHALHPG